MAKDTNILIELQELSATVANLKGKTPFSLPSSYFEKFPQKILERIEKEALTKEDPCLSTSLQSMKESNPFTVPEQYFNQFNVKLPESQPKLVAMNYKRWVSYAAAACIAGLIIGLVFFYNSTDKSDSLAEHAISQEAMETYLSEAETLEIGEKDAESLTIENNTSVDVSPSSISEMLKDIPDKTFHGLWT